MEHASSIGMDSTPTNCKRSLVERLRDYEHKQALEGGDFFERLLENPQDPYVQEVYTNLISTMKHEYEKKICVVDPKILDSLANAIESLQVDSLKMHYGFLIGLVHCQHFANYCMEHSRPEIRVFIPRLKDEMHKCLMGKTLEGANPTRFVDVGYRHWHDFVYTMRSIYFFRWNCFGVTDQYYP